MLYYYFYYNLLFSIGFKFNLVFTCTGLPRSEARSSDTFGRWAGRRSTGERHCCWRARHCSKTLHTRTGSHPFGEFMFEMFIFIRMKNAHIGKESKISNFECFCCFPVSHTNYHSKNVLLIFFPLWQAKSSIFITPNIESKKYYSNVISPNNVSLF